MNEMNLKQIATAMQEADVRAVGPDAYLKNMHAFTVSGCVSGELT